MAGEYWPSLTCPWNGKYWSDPTYPSVDLPSYAGPHPMFPSDMPMPVIWGQNPTVAEIIEKAKEMTPEDFHAWVLAMESGHEPHG